MRATKASAQRGVHPAPAIIRFVLPWLWSTSAGPGLGPARETSNSPDRTYQSNVLRYSTKTTRPT